MSEQKTPLEQISDLHEIADFMGDAELTTGLEFIAKIILKPDIPPQVAAVELMRLQAIGAKMAMRATFMANVSKDDRARKNLYFTCSEQINLVCQALKVVMKVGT